MSELNKQHIPIFTKEHLDYLERVYPELVDISSKSEMAYHHGKRQVVQHIRHLILTAKKREELKT